MAAVRSASSLTMKAQHFSPLNARWYIDAKYAALKPERNTHKFACAHQRFIRGDGNGGVGIRIL